jgi:hypothetical protein
MWKVLVLNLRNYYICMWTKYITALEFQKNRKKKHILEIVLGFLIGLALL